MAVATLTFADRLAAEVERKRSQLVVGLDPNPDLLPVELRGDVARFCCGIVDAVAPYAVCVKPQLAFFEALGPRGMAEFDQVCAYARRAGLLVIADGKRGDIGSTARAYADAYLEGDPPRADALTVNPWLGRDAIEPFLGAVRRGGAGIFVLVRPRTRRRRPGRRAQGRPPGVASRRGAGGRVGRGVDQRGRAVVGRRRRRRDASARGRRREAPDAADDHAAPGRRCAGRLGRGLGRAFQSGPASALVSASRSVIYAYRESGDGLPGGGRRRGVAPSARGLGRLRLVVRRDDWRRYVGPAAFLLAVTIAVVLIRSGMNAGSSNPARPPRRPRARRTARRPTPPRTPARPALLDRSAPATRSASSRAKTGVAVATLARLNPKVVARPRSSSASGSASNEAAPRRCCASPPRRRSPARGRGSARPGRRRAPGSSRTPAPARCSARRKAHERLPIASITKLMTVLVDARASLARRRRRRRPSCRRRRRVERRPQRGRPAHGRRPRQGGADPVGQRRRRRARAVGRARLHVVRRADEREGTGSSGSTTRTSSGPTGSTRLGMSRAPRDVTKLARVADADPVRPRHGRRADRDDRRRPRRCTPGTTC